MNFRPTFAALALLGLAACDPDTTLETRTFPLDNLYAGDAMALLDPYVYGDRPGAPGSMSAIEGALTVRETPDNLEKIARVLAEYDAPRGSIQLAFRLIQAGAFPDESADLGAVREELERLFDFDGYRLLGEAFVTATDRSEIAQAFAGDHSRGVRAEVQWIRPNLIRLHEVQLLGTQETYLTTSVNIRPGQTLVLGSGSAGPDEPTLFLTVEAHETTGNQDL
ncbi:MAG: hypothetical protein RH859_11605 [Longimicrobiales bacterium]